jgi:hypothetical protein
VCPFGEQQTSDDDHRGSGDPAYGARGGWPGAQDRPRENANA